MRWMHREEVLDVNPSYPYDPDMHEPGSLAGQGTCSYHGEGIAEKGAACGGAAVVSYQDDDGVWQSGCSLALEQLVDRGDIQPLGQGA